MRLEGWGRGVGAVECGMGPWGSGAVKPGLRGVKAHLMLHTHGHGFAIRHAHPSNSDCETLLPP